MVEKSCSAPTICYNHRVKRIIFHASIVGLLAWMPLTVASEQAPVPPAASETAVDLMKMERDARCGQILVTGIVGGTPMRLMLDTGATHTVLHEESAAKLKQAQWVDTSRMMFRGNSAQIPKLVLTSLLVGPGESDMHPIMVMNLDAVRSMMVEKVDGIVGMDFLSSLPFTFDFSRQEYYWGMPEGGQLFPIPGEKEASGRVVLHLKSGDKELSLLLDTGSSVTRLCAEDWAPGAAGEISAHIGNIDTAKQARMIEGKPGELSIAPGIALQGVTPLLCERGEITMLGLDALKDSVLIHIPGAPGTGFFMRP